MTLTFFSPQVTHLLIERPPLFHYRPGDYLYLNVPSIALYEWHPFTISSAPEQKGTPPPLCWACTCGVLPGVGHRLGTRNTGVNKTGDPKSPSKTSL